MKQQQQQQQQQQRFTSFPTSATSIPTMTPTKMTWLVLAVILLGFEAALGVPVRSPPSFLEPGKCASTTLMENFQVNRYLGRWYPVWNVPNSYITSQSCTADTMFIAGKKMKIVTTGLTDVGTPARSQAKLNFITPKNKKKAPFMQLEASMVPAVPYYVLDTDYANYSCVYSCFGLLGLKAELYWIYSRTPQPSAEVEQKCFDLFREIELDMSRMVQINQEGCDHPADEVDSGMYYGSLDGDQGEDEGNSPEEGRGGRTQLDSNDDEDESEGSGDMPTNLESSHPRRSEVIKSTFEETIIIEEDTVKISINGENEAEESYSETQQRRGQQGNSASTILGSFTLATASLVLLSHLN